MAETPERRIKKLVSKTLTALGAYYFYPVTSGYGTSGVFDIVVCYKGWFIGIECKADMKKKGPTKLQSVNARRAITTGGIVLLLDASNCAMLADTLSALPEKYDVASEKPNRLSVWPFDGVTD